MQVVGSIGHWGNELTRRAVPVHLKIVLQQRFGQLPAQARICFILWGNTVTGDIAGLLELDVHALCALLWQGLLCVHMHMPARQE